MAQNSNGSVTATLCLLTTSKRKRSAADKLAANVKDACHPDWPNRRHGLSLALVI
jgi:hypothetical protein